MARLKARKGLLILFALVLVTSLAIMALPMAGTVEAATPIYVSGAAGNDTWDGTSPTWVSGTIGPKKTIQAGINVVDAGDTVNVAAGTYDEEVIIDKSLTLISDTGDYRTTGVIMNGPIALNNVESVTIQGFKFQDYSSSGYAHVIYTGGTADNITIAANSFESCKGLNIHIYYLDTWFENWTITGNKITNVTGTDASGIWVQRLRNSTISNNEISNTTYAGMILDRIENVTVSNNEISDTPRKGIQVATSPNCNVVIKDNYITNTNTSHAADEGAISIYPDVTNIRIENNTLTANYQGFTVRDKAETVSDVYVNFNNIYGNDGFGIGNFAQGGGTLNATHNWWGAKDGPGGVGPGSGDAVSANVDYDPWLGAELEEVQSETISGSGTMQDTPTGGDITIDATGNHTITAAKYANNPGGPCPFTNEGSYYDVHLDDATNVTSLTIQFCPAHENEAIYYWDGSSYVACSNQVYSDGCIVVTITDATQPSLSDLTGLPFGKGFVLPVPVGGEAYPINKASVLAPWIVLAVLLAGGISWFTLRRRRAQSQT